MKTKAILTAIIGVIMVISFSACSSSAKLTPEDVITVKQSGMDGDGMISLTWNYDKIKDIMKEKLGDKYESGYHDDYFTLLFDTSAEYEADEYTGLSNGDTVTISFKKTSKAAFEDAEISIEDGTFTYTVEGLPEVTEITYDPFEGFTLEYIGISPGLDIKLDKSGCDEFVQKNVNFETEKYSDFANGDKIIVTATLWKTEDTEKNEKYTLASATYEHKTGTVTAYVTAEKEYTVEGLPFYINDAAGYDWTTIDDRMLEEANAGANKQFPIGKTQLEAVIVPDGSYANYYTVDAIEIVPSDNVFFLYSKGNSLGIEPGYNQFIDSVNARIRVYACNMTISRNGVTKTATKYITIFSGDFIDKGDGKISPDEVDYSYLVHIHMSYENMDMNEIEQYWKDELGDLFTIS